jgi:hypothetical protein
MKNGRIIHLPDSVPPEENRSPGNRAIQPSRHSATGTTTTNSPRCQPGIAQIGRRRSWLLSLCGRKQADQKTNKLPLPSWRTKFAADGRCSTFSVPHCLVALLTPIQPHFRAVTGCFCRLVAVCNPTRLARPARPQFLDGFSLRPYSCQSFWIKGKHEYRNAIPTMNEYSCQPFWVKREPLPHPAVHWYGRQASQ